MPRFASICLRIDCLRPAVPCPLVSGANVTTQALDNAYISITTAMDPDSGIKLVRAKVDGLVRPSGTWATTCAQEPGVEVLPWISLPTTKVAPGDSQDFVLPVTMLYVHVVVPEGTRTAVGDNLVSLGPLLF